MAQLSTAPTPVSAAIDSKPVKAEIVPVSLEHMPVQFKEMDSLSRTTVYEGFLPTSPNTDNWSLAEYICVLKMGAFSAIPIPLVIGAVHMARKLNLNVLLGDIYVVNGKLALTNQAKLTLARRTGLIVGARHSFTTLGASLPLETQKACGRLKDFDCTVSFKVKGWDERLELTQRFSDWYMPKSGPWNKIPEHMLLQNTQAKCLSMLIDMPEDAELASTSAPSTPVLPLPTPPLYKGDGLSDGEASDLINSEEVKP